MRPHRLTASAVALLAAVALAIGGAVPASAAPQRLADSAARALPAASILNKVILPETSLDGPALASIGPNPSESVLAWTDPSFHLDVATSSDGLHFANKLTLDETSPFRPDVAIASAGGPIMLAWVGTDPHHSLNVLYDVYGSHPAKLTLPQDQSFAPPALLYGPGFLLAWTGTDANHSLNILPLRVTPSVTPSLEAGPTTVLTQLSSLVIAGPHLRRNSATVIALDWISPSLQPEFATSTDGVHFGTATALPELSTAAPDTYSLAPFSPPPSGPIREWVGWTGFDAAHHLNVQWTTTFAAFSDPATTRTVLDTRRWAAPRLPTTAATRSPGPAPTLTTT